MAINYFNLSEDEAKEMKKPELCKYIRKILTKIDYDEEHKDSLIGKSSNEINNNDSKDTNNSDNLNYIYKGDINNCVDSPNRGGINLKELKKIAVYNFGIDVNGKLKEEICSNIKTKLNENKKNIKKELKIDKNAVKSIKTNKTTFNDLLKNIDDDEEDLKESSKKDADASVDEEDEEENEYITNNYEISDNIYSKKSLTDFDDDED